MAKPILIAEIPDKGFSNDYEMRESTYTLNAIRAGIIKNTCGEYHVLVISKKSINDVNVYVLNADKIDPIEIENLKQLVEEKWLNINT